MAIVARAREGLPVIIHAIDLGIQAPPARAGPAFYGPARAADGGAWAMARPRGQAMGANAIGSAAAYGRASAGARPPLMAPGPLAIGWGPGARSAPPSTQPRPIPAPQPWAQPGAIRGGSGWPMANWGACRGARPRWGSPWR
jgi:hypothetical protein